MARRALVLVVAACGASAPPPAPAPANHAPGLVVLADVPPDALELDVRVFRWSCTVALPDGTIFPDPNLHVPIGRAVRLVLSDPDLDLDVEILGTSAREHLTHGAVKQLAFRLDGPAEYHWKCPVQEPPGNPIADSTTFAIIPMAPDAYAAFEKTTRHALNPTTREGKIELGKKLYEKKGCVACHSIDGSPRVGPSWAHIWGTSVAAADGTTRTIDADFVRESVLHPTAFAAAGFPPSMPSFEGQLKPAELEALVTYIESLQ